MDGSSIMSDKSKLPFNFTQAMDIVVMKKLTKQYEIHLKTCLEGIELFKKDQRPEAYLLWHTLSRQLTSPRMLKYHNHYVDMTYRMKYDPSYPRTREVSVAFVNLDMIHIKYHKAFMLFIKLLDKITPDDVLKMMDLRSKRRTGVKSLRGKKK